MHYILNDWQCSYCAYATTNSLKVISKQAFELVSNVIHKYNLMELMAVGDI